MSVPAFYGRHAALYDRIATLPGVGRWRAVAADALAPASGATVVEMGCGTGANLPYLRDRVGPTGRVVGLDLTRPLLVRARGRGADALLHADATRPPLAGADAVLGTFVSGMVADPAGTVEGWCDLVGPGGQVALLDAAPSRHPTGRLLNPLFGAFTVASAPSASLLDPPYDAVAELDDRVAAAHEALAGRVETPRAATHALGFVRLTAGTVV